MQTYRYLVTYTNDKRETEVKARNEEEAKYLLECKAKMALMQIVKIELKTILN